MPAYIFAETSFAEDISKTGLVLHPGIELKDNDYHGSASVRIEMFVIDNCPFCDRAKENLLPKLAEVYEGDISIRIINIEGGESAKYHDSYVEYFDIPQGTVLSVPKIIINNKHAMVGYQDSDIETIKGVIEDPAGHGYTKEDRVFGLRAMYSIQDTGEYVYPQTLSRAHVTNIEKTGQKSNRDTRIVFMIVVAGIFMLGSMAFVVKTYIAEEKTSMPEKQ